MDFGIVFANTGPFTSGQGATTLAKLAEAAGFESLWTVEHVVVPEGYESTYPYDPSGKMPGGDTSPIPDPLIWLTYVAAATTKITLATGILILPQRNPLVLAKELATLDFMSSGRMNLGIGVGWLEEEFNAIGVPFADRARRTDEYVQALRALLGEQPASFSGEFVNFNRCVVSPQPVQAEIPITIGGHTSAAARRAGRLGNGFFPASGSHRQLREQFDLVRQTAEEQGRDPGAIEFTSGGYGVFGDNALAEAEQLAELGVSRIVVPAFLFYQDPESTLAHYGETVIQAFNGK
jgi:probable F420-dependent oxidoreductase